MILYHVWCMSLRTATSQIWIHASVFLFILVPKKNPNIVQKPNNFFNGDASSSSFLIAWMLNVAPTWDYGALKGGLDLVLDTLFLSVADRTENAAVTKGKFLLWYSVVDRCRLSASILLVIDTALRMWDPFVWNLMVVYPSSKKEEYRQLASVQNEQSIQQNTYECTVCDLLRGQRIEWDYRWAEPIKISPIGRRGSWVIHRCINRRSDGGDHYANTFLKQAVSVSSWLSSPTLKAGGTITNMTFSDVYVPNVGLNEK